MTELLSITIKGKRKRLRRQRTMLFAPIEEWQHVMTALCNVIQPDACDSGCPYPKENNA